MLEPSAGQRLHAVHNGEPPPSIPHAQSDSADAAKTNWIMYLYSISGLLSGARSVLYDGSPTLPSADAFLEILSRQGLTHFGTSASFLDVLERAGVSARTLPDFSRLEVITSTGSVLTESQYHWVYKTFGAVQLSSIAGGTDIAGACKSNPASQFYHRRPF